MNQLSRQELLQQLACVFVGLSFVGMAYGESPPVTVPEWPTKWHTPPSVPIKAINADVLKPQGKMRKVELPDTLDLAELCGLSANVLIGNMDPHWQAYNFGVDPPRGVDRGAVLPKHIRTLLLVRAASGSTHGLDVEATQMKNQLDSLTNQSKTPNSYFFGPGYGPLVLALANWNERVADPLYREWIAYLARLMRENALLVGDRAYYPPSSLRDQAGKWYNGDSRGQSPIPYKAPDEPTADQQGFEGTVKWEQALVLRALLRDYQLNGNKDSLAMAGKFSRFILQPTMWEKGGPDNGKFAGHFHGNMWTLQAVLEYALVSKDADAKKIVVKAYEYARSRGVVDMGWFPSWVDPEHFKRAAVFAQLNETCGVADALMLALKLSEAGLGDYWDDIDAMARNHLSQMQFTSLDVMRKYSGNKLENDRLLKPFVGGFGMAGPTTIQPQVIGCCSANGGLALYQTWRSILDRDENGCTVNLLMNRVSPWIDVASHLPFEGRVDIRVHDAERVRVRIPGWIDKEKVRVQINGEDAKPEWKERFISLTKLQAGDVLSVRFDVPEREVERDFGWRKYTLQFRGSTLADIQPRPKDAALIPLYPEERTKGRKAVVRTVERFVTTIFADRRDR